ncbi:MAG: ABC transporter ATP-binding protein [Sphingobacteriaceae bacterium]|nr:ABC transporter ATP-binding protein [Sphingobacteriaceae bacterium]
MSDVVIKVENLGKQYRLGSVGTGTVSHDLNRWWYKVRGKEDPYLKIGDVNDRTQRGESDLVWALKDINFEVRQGDVLGIIGKNGAGKSTLLKILSRVTGPTLGNIKVRGRIASLLEVGTGFHPELTGRENIFLNGAILGMTKNEIKSKFDEIVDFSGVERYIDTPVKRYSSGMYVRLAFAVAAHLEPEILIVDEVLAVGDAEFQRKCLGKMKDVSGQGRTVLFVSHNLQAVSNLCNTGIVLKNGRVETYGNIEDCVKSYIISSRNTTLINVSNSNRLKRTNGNVIFEEVKAVKNNEECWEFNYDEDICVNIKVKVQVEVDDLSFYLAIKNPFSGEIISNFKLVISDKKLEIEDCLSFSVIIPFKTIRPGQYALYFALGDAGTKIFYDVVDENVNLPILNINPVSMDVHENSGFVTLPIKIQY